MKMIIIRRNGIEWKKKYDYVIDRRLKIYIKRIINKETKLANYQNQTIPNDL